MSNARRGRIIKDEKRGTWGYVVDVAAPGEKRKQERKRGFATRGEAVDALNKITRAVADGEYVETSKMTLSEWLDEYVDTQAATGHLRPTTADGYRRLHDWHVRPTIGRLRLQALRGSDLTRLYGELLTSGRRRGAATRGDGLSPGTIRQVHALLSGALKEAWAQGFVVANVAKRAKPPASKTPETRRGPSPRRKRSSIIQPRSSTTTRRFGEPQPRRACAGANCSGSGGMPSTLMLGIST